MRTRCSLLFRIQLGRAAAMSMNTLSRREEETLLKSTKARALQECDDIVKGAFVCSVFGGRTRLRARDQSEFASCAGGRTITVAWACRDKYKAVQECMLR